MKVDVLVVGSGPLGSAAARRLAERGRQVLILEQGPAISDPPASHIRNAGRFHQDPDAYLGAATSHLEFLDDSVDRDSLPGAAVTRAQGGQGVIWTNLCPRGDAPWEALTPQEWDAYYGIAESYLGVQSAEFESSLRQQKIRKKLGEALSPDGRRVEALPVAARYDDGRQLHYAAPHDILAGDILAGSAAPTGVRVSRATVDALEHEGPRVTAAVADGQRIEVEDIVLAAGAIGTPQLLHRSGIRPEALGRWLSYHPLLVAQLVLDEELCAAPGERDREPRLQIPPTPQAEWYSLVLRDVSPFQPEAPDLDIDPNRLVEVQGICPVDVSADKGIRFDAASRPTFQVPLSAADEKRMEGAMADADRIADLLGRYRQGCRPQWMPFGFAHMTGTTRMSAENDGSGVADYRGRVWGFENLRLATNGLVPTRMAVNPTLTGVALSIFVADGLVQG